MWVNWGFATSCFHGLQQPLPSHGNFQKCSRYNLKNNTTLCVSAFKKFKISFVCALNWDFKKVEFKCACWPFFHMRVSKSQQSDLLQFSQSAVGGSARPLKCHVNQIHLESLPSSILFSAKSAVCLFTFAASWLLHVKPRSRVAPARRRLWRTQEHMCSARHDILPCIMHSAAGSVSMHACVCAEWAEPECFYPKQSAHSMFGFQGVQTPDLKAN